MTNYKSVVVILLHLTSAWSACILLDNCPVARKYVDKRRDDPETRKILLNAHCGVVKSGGRIYGKVNCDQIPDFEEPEQAKSKLHLLPKQDECGIQAPGSKITMGQKADFEDFPWLALFQYKNVTNDVAYRCHGSLISKRYVLTAAHCLSYNSASRVKIGELHKVILGEYDTNTAQDCLPPTFGTYCTDPVQAISPESIHVHPEFGTQGALSDIGLVRLAREAVMSDFVKPICLPLDPVVLKRHDPMIISGWGKTETRKPSNVKLKAKISYLTNDECSQYNVDYTQICAGSSTGADTCKGDSGGPLMITRLSADRDAKNILIGIVSYGGRCGSGAAIYTNVTTFIKWILDTITE